MSLYGTPNYLGAAVAELAQLPAGDGRTEPAVLADGIPHQPVVPAAVSTHHH